MKKRVTIQRQFIVSFACVLLLSALTAFAAMMAFYTFYHHFFGEDAKAVKYLDPKSTVIFVLIDLGIPFLCIIGYSLLFARRLSRGIKSPLEELMGAVEKIRNRDLDFTVKGGANNEIGDLADAIEGMRGALKESLTREWRLEQERRDMVAAITHDMKTPLTIIQGHVEGLQDGLKNDMGKLDEYLMVIEKNSLRAKKLIDDMNELVETEGEDFHLNPAETDLVEFIKSKAGELKILAERKSICFDTGISTELESCGIVFVDCGRLSRVIDNVVGNSIRFTPEGGSISMDARIEGRGARFVIRDSGPGFDEKDLANLFKKFYKGDRSRSIEKDHSGLGLYISKTLVEKMGGGIKASNLPEGGACVDFTIACGSLENN